MGLGHASPIVHGERVYQFARRGEDEVMAALALADGALLWRDGYAAPYRMNPAAASHGPGPKSTPLLAEGRVFAFGIGGALTAWRAEDGERLWQRRFEELGEVAPTYGTALSPLLARGRLVVHVGSGSRGALIAVDPASGETLWQLRGDGPGYASPVVAEVEGIAQVVTFGESRILGVELESGALLWEERFTTPYEQNSVTPLVRGDVLVYSGLEQGLRAARLVRREGRWGLEPLWQADQLSLYMSSPVAVGGALLGFSHMRRGQLFAVDLASGALLWRSEGRQGENAALLAGERAAVALMPDARLVVFRAGGERFEPLASYSVADSATWAHPAPLADGFLIKDVERLTRWRLP